MRNAGLEETQAGIKIARRNINNLRYADDTTLMAESEEELKSLLMKVKVWTEEPGRLQSMGSQELDAADKAMIKRLIVVDQVAVRHRSHGSVNTDSEAN